jgi:hypothetical protein
MSQFTLAGSVGIDALWMHPSIFLNNNMYYFVYVLYLSVKGRDKFHFVQSTSN